MTHETFSCLSCVEAVKSGVKSEPWGQVRSAAVQHTPNIINTALFIYFLRSEYVLIVRADKQMVPALYPS